MGKISHHGELIEFQGRCCHAACLLPARGVGRSGSVEFPGAAHHTELCSPDPLERRNVLEL